MVGVQPAVGCEMSMGCTNAHDARARVGVDVMSTLWRCISAGQTLRCKCALVVDRCRARVTAVTHQLRNVRQLGYHLIGRRQPAGALEPERSCHRHRSELPCRTQLPRQRQRLRQPPLGQAG